MTSTVHNITTLKSPKTIILKKVAIAGVAVLGLIAVGAVAFVASKSSEEAVSEETSE